MCSALGIADEWLHLFLLVHLTQSFPNAGLSQIKYSVLKIHSEYIYIYYSEPF